MNRDLRSVRWMWRCAGFAAVATIGWLLYNMVGQWGPFFKADAMSTRGKSEMEARRIMKKPPKFVLTPVDVKRDGINAPWIGRDSRRCPRILYTSVCSSMKKAGGLRTFSSTMRGE